MDTKARFELEQVLGKALSDYRDLQAPRPTIYQNPPTALEALRMTHAAHPAVIYGFSPLKPVLDADVVDWDRAATYADLVKAGHDQAGLHSEGMVTIAVTDDGFADSVRLIPSNDSATPNGVKAFVKPLEEIMPIQTFLKRLQDPGNEPEVLYLQSQDGNIYRSYEREDKEELRGMREWVKRDVEWMRDAAGETAEAVNVWIGSERSTTSLHHDPYDNIYHVLSGTKTLTLISPIEGLWLDQRFHPSATLRRIGASLVPVLDSDASPAGIPWVESNIYPRPIQPIEVTLHKGETLFLPAGWWHAVDQKEGPGGLAVAVNYWYTSPIHPERNALLQLAQRTARLAGREGVIPVASDTESAPATPGDTPDLGAASIPSPTEGGATGKEMAEKGIPDIWGDEDDLSGEEWDPTEWRKQRQEARSAATAALGAAKP